MPANLNRKQQREIKAVVERAKKDNGIPQTAQQSIPFQRMFPDGICRVTDSYYTKTIQFQDINYQLAQQEDKTAIFDEWCSFLNFFDSSIHFELSFMNLSTDAESFEKSIRIPFKKDSFNPVRAEYSQMLKKQLAQGNNGLTKTKYLTFGIEAESMRQAKPRLNHIENDLLNNFRRLGVIATTMNGKERLHLMHSMFHMGDNDKFFFDWKYLVESGLSVKDFIAPTAFAFKTNRTFQMGSIFGSMSYLAITASDLSDRMLADFLDMESTQIVTMHIQSVDQTAAIKTIKRIITELDRSKIEEQKKAVRSGYDMDIIPSDLATYGKDAKSLLKELQSQNERMFMVTFLVLNTGRTEQELENNVFQAQSIAQKHNCNLRRLDFQQESGLMSSLPLAQNLIEIRRGLTTSSTAIFVPFTTQELFQNGGETLYYGLNALSNNLIMVDRKKLKNPNGLILGTPGSGKSFSAKREITNAFLVTDDDIIICDPEAEYAALVHKFNGQVVKISSSSTNYINPMDINLNYSEDDNPVALKADFILSLCELIMGSKDGLQPIEKTVIDRCVHQIYQRYFDNPAPENMPILEDLYDALLKQDEKEAHHVATALEIYVKGSLKLFNNRTNVDIQNRLVCFDIKELGNQLKKIGMLIVQDQVWGRVTANRSAGKSTRYYIDEFHLLLKEEQTATYSVEIWKRFRKWGGLPTGITQNVKDLLRSPEIANILENSDFIYMLNQASDDRSILAQRLNISPHQLSYVTNSGEGEGLLFYGNVILPFIDRFPTDLELYRIMTTKLNEVAQEKEAYAAAKAGKNTASTTASASKGAGKATGKAAQGAKNITERVTEFCTTHSKTILFVLIAGLLFMILSGMFSSCSAMFQGGTQIILGTSFTAKEEDIIGADNDYKALEAALRNKINNIERTHSGYDEYRYDLDEINHNPYELAAYLTVKFEDYTRDEVQATLQWLFEQQYELTLTEVVEIRTRTTSSTDPETGETTTEEEDYEYYILNVKLRNKGLNSVISNSGLSEDDMERYRILLQTRGNRPDIFGNDIYATPGGEYTDYDIPGEALTDTRFANMIREAEKYLGYPYVWGGSSPSTSFDCSGFVSYVINHCGNGWSVGRLTANGLMGVCDIIPKSSAKPGDLIFFQGTYDTSGASHVGIYVGNGMMIHCGNPISYASIESNYWQQHFYCFGRIRN